MRLAVLALLVVACTSPSAVAPTARPSPTAAVTTAPATPTPVARAPVVSDAPVQSGLRAPWDIAFAPDGRMFVTERPGTLIVFESGAPNARRLATYAVPDVRAQGEAGLMGIALDPDFARTGHVYVCASRSVGAEFLNQILRLRATGNEVALDRVIVATGMRAANIHDGCALRFGPDGKLWASMGDAAQSALAQDVTSLNGKILRVNGDGTVPADNPVLPGTSAPSLIWSHGHRNPQGIAFQPGTGTPFAVEHGATTHDEINILEKGANYGWPRAEGPDPQKRYKDPIWSSGSSTIATSGATFVSGAAWGSWSGSLFVAQLKESDLRRFTIEGGVAVQREILLDGKYGRLRTPVQGPDGALYVTTSAGSGDRIVRIAPTQP